MLRKIAVAAASKPAVEIKQEGDTFYIKTSTTVRTTEINFNIGEEFEEQTVDGRPCKVRAGTGSLRVMASVALPLNMTFSSLFLESFLQFQWRKSLDSGGGKKGGASPIPLTALSLLWAHLT